MEGESAGYSRDTVFSDILGCRRGIPAAGRPIVYVYEDTHRLQDPRIHPLILNSGYIHYPIGRTDRHGAGKTKENPKENCFKPEISFEIPLRKKMKGGIEDILV